MGTFIIITYHFRNFLLNEFTLKSETFSNLRFRNDKLMLCGFATSYLFHLLKLSLFPNRLIFHLLITHVDMLMFYLWLIIQYHSQLLIYSLSLIVFFTHLLTDFVPAAPSESGEHSLFASESQV